MSAAIVIALIALAGSLISTLATVFGAPALQGRRDARRALDTYREPLLAAAFELQARLYNILEIGFIGRYIDGEGRDKREPAIQSTLYVIAQYFGWREIIRQEVQYLRFRGSKDTRAISGLLRDVGETFLSDSDKYGHQFMIWRVEQRGLGEKMIEPANHSRRCLGYAAFIEQRASLARWLDPLERDLQELDDRGRARLRRLQHLLLDLVERMDEKHTRYPPNLTRA